jgi:hypothetical protein
MSEPRLLKGTAIFLGSACDGRLSGGMLDIFAI